MIPFPVAGPTGGHKSKQYNSEVTQNMYLDRQETGRTGVHDFPGLKPWSSGIAADRGHHVMNGVLYSLQGTVLYKVASDGVLTSCGTVTGVDRAIFADDGTNLYFTCNNLLWKYNGTSISNVTQSVVANPSSIAYINRKFVLSGDDGLFAVSDVADGDTYNSLKFAEAEAKPDSLIRVYQFMQLVYMMGSLSTEPWYDAGVGDPPLNRQDTALVNVGIAGKHAVCNTDRFMYWLGDDKKVYQCVGANARPVQDPPTAYSIDRMTNISDCIASAFVMNGQDFVLFTFPTENKTLMFSETLSYWVKMSTGVTGGRWMANAMTNCYGKTLASDYRNANIYQLDYNTYTDNSDARLRIRTFPVFTSDFLQDPGKSITITRVTLNMETGVGLATGQGSAPVLLCQFSNDGGHTWQEEIPVSMGINGNYYANADIYGFCTGRKIRLRIKCTDPVYLSMFEGMVDMRIAGW